MTPGVGAGAAADAPGVASMLSASSMNRWNVTGLPSVSLAVRTSILTPDAFEALTGRNVKLPDAFEALT